MKLGEKELEFISSGIQVTIRLNLVDTYAVLFLQIFVYYNLKNILGHDFLAIIAFLVITFDL